MKFSWGTGIAIFYSLFVLTFVFLVIKSTTYDNSLVSEQYYADDLNYQQHYDKLVNSQALENDLSINKKISEGLVELSFPKELGEASGEIHFFCPSNSKLDFKVPVKPDETFRQTVPLAKLRKQGLWRIKVDWKANGKNYYKESVLTI